MPLKMQLTKDQQYCFDLVEGTQSNYLVQGKPGVGKSVLTRSLIQEGNKNYTIAAPTGLAALNIGGKTLHSIFRLPISEGILHPSYNNFVEDERTVNFIRYQIKTLIIDECSMVRVDQFEYIERYMRWCKQSALPFGGAQVILVGDFYQLPPVANTKDIVQLREAGWDSPFLFSSKVFSDSFKILELDEVLRQKGDNKFIKLLHSARTGQLTDKMLIDLNKRVETSDGIRISLCGTNAQAEAINQRRLGTLPEPTYVFTGVKYGEWPALPAEEILTIKVGAQVMVKMNSADKPPGITAGDFNSKVVNGTLGIVLEVYKPSSTVLGEQTNPVFVVIKTESGDEVKIYTKRWERKIKVRIEDKWEEEVVASFEQMPLALAWAISIHKSQGQTFEHVHIDAGKIFAPGQMYVALSRCKTLSGVSLQSPLTKGKFWANSAVTKFFNSIEV